MLRTFSKSVVNHSKLFKNIHTSAVSRLKQIFVEKKDKTTVIECKYIESPREPYLLKLDNRDGKCALCSLQLDLKHTDVLILSQFIDTEGRVLKFKYTNLCREQYKLVKELIYMAQYAGLLPEPPRDEPKKPYQLLNTYYDETTINIRPKYRKYNLRYHYLEKRLGPIEKQRVKPHIGGYYGSALN